MEPTSRGGSEISGVNPAKNLASSLAIGQLPFIQRTIGFVRNSVSTSQRNQAAAFRLQQEQVRLMKASVPSHHGFESISIAQPDGRTSLIRHAGLINFGERTGWGGSRVPATNKGKQAEVQATIVLYLLPESKVRAGPS